MPAEKKSGDKSPAAHVACHRNPKCTRPNRHPGHCKVPGGLSHRPKKQNKSKRERLGSTGEGSTRSHKKAKSNSSFYDHEPASPYKRSRSSSESDPSPTANLRIELHDIRRQDGLYGSVTRVLGLRQMSDGGYGEETPLPGTFDEGVAFGAVNSLSFGQHSNSTSPTNSVQDGCEGEKASGGVLGGDVLNLAGRRILPPGQSQPYRTPLFNFWAQQRSKGVTPPVELPCVYVPQD